MREKVYVNIDMEILAKLREEKEQTGLPISRQLENAWREKHESL